MNLAEISARLRSILVRVERSRNLTEGRPWVLGLAFAVFAVISVTSVANLPDSPRSPALAHLPLIGLLTLGTLVVNGLEFMVAGQLADRRLGLRRSVQTTILSSAANVLPIPGAALVRVRALREEDVSYRRAFTATAVVGVTWLAASAVGAGGLLLWQGHTVPGMVMVLLGSVALCSPFLLRPDDLTIIGRLMVIEFSSAVITTLRLFFVARASGFDVSLSAAATLGLSGVLASAAGLFPGGLGLREGLSAATAPLTGTSAPIAVVISALDRIVFYVVLAAVSLVLVVLARFRPTPTTPVPPATDVATSTNRESACE